MPPAPPAPGAPRPARERDRLMALLASDVLDTPPERAFDDLTALASAICGTPIALVSLVDADRQWFKSRIGLQASQTPRELAFCAHAIVQPDAIFEVPDATADARFADNPLVTGDPGIRFYAGAPILSAEGHALGTMCVIDRRPRRLDAQQREALGALARTAAELMRARRDHLELRRGSEALRAMFDQAQVGMVISDPAGRLLRVNDRFCELLGQEATTLIGRSIEDVTHPEDRAQDARLIERLEATGHPVASDKRYLRADGRAVWVRNQVSALRDADGALVAIVAAVEDLSEQRRIEGRIRESEERFIAMAQAAPLKMWITDAGGACTFINRHWCDYVGQPMATQLGAGRHAAVHADEAAALRGAFEAASASRSLFRKEYRLRRHDGVYRWHVDAATPRFDDAGEFLGYIGSAVDVHDEREARLALERLASERGATLDAVLDSMSSGVVAVDTQGRRLVYNRAAAELTGLDSIDAGPAAWGRQLGVHDRAGRAMPDQDLPLVRALRGEVVDGVEMRLLDPERELDLTLAAGARPIVGAGGKPLGAVMVFADVTARLRSEQALAESEARFRMIMDVAPQIVWTASRDGAIEFINRTGVAYFGRPIEQLLGDGWLSSLHPDDVPVLRRTWGPLLQTGEPVEVQYRIRRHDGEFRWHIARGVARFDEQGRPERWYGIVTDVEDLRRAQAAAEAATLAKSQFLANMSHEIRTPMNGVIGMTSLLSGTGLSEAQREYVDTIRASGEHLMALINDILDFSKIEAGKLDLEHYAFALRGCVEEALELVAQPAETKGLELILDCAPGLPRQVMGDAGRLRQILVNLLSNAVKFTPAGEVLVRVTVRALSSGGSNWRLRFEVQDQGIGIPADRMDRLFGVFSQVDASHTRTYGGSGLGLAICKRLVEHMNGRIWAHSAEGRGATFSFEVELGAVEGAGLPVADTLRFAGKRLLLVDDNRTNRRVLRLMLESWGFVVDEAVDGPDALVQVSLHDYEAGLLDFNMPGMTGVQLVRALRARDATARLPLFLLGSISGVHAPEDEAMFTARMLKPLRQSTLFDQLALLFGELPALRRASDAPAGLQAQTHPLRILVAEDNSVNQKVALRFLERMGYSADLVGNGLEAVEAVLRQAYDVVLMDVQMPHMDGYTATREIRERLAQDPYVVAVTANVLAGDEQRCRDAGMDDYLSKPIDPRRLGEVLRRAAGRSAMRAPEPAPGVAPPPDEAAPDPAAPRPIARLLAQLEEAFGADGARDLVEVMQEDLPVQRAAFERAIAAADRMAASRVAHSLKSTVRTCGDEALGQALQAAEKALLAGDAGAPAQMQALFGRCGSLFEGLAQAIRQ